MGAALGMLRLENEENLQKLTPGRIFEFENDLYIVVYEISHMKFHVIVLDTVNRTNMIKGKKCTISILDFENFESPAITLYR